MHALALVLAIALASPPNASPPPPPSSAPSHPASASQDAASETVPKRELHDLGKIGVGLAGVGAALACSTAAGYTLITVLNTPDDNRNKPQDPQIVQTGGFAVIALGSLSAGAILIGSALLLSDVVNNPVMSAPPAP